MFGFVTASLSSLDEQEKERYQAFYCGLCRALGERHGAVARMCLTYDLTFYVMLCHSLCEPAEEAGQVRCPTRPTRKVPYVQSEWSDLAADLSVVLAYHKCLDDWCDDRAPHGLAGELALSRAYERVKAEHSAICAVVEQDLGEISQVERRPLGATAIEAAGQPDASARLFGHLLGEIFAYRQPYWGHAMRQFGCELGRLIYLMDAAIDLEEDRKHGSYNPLAPLDLSHEDTHTLLGMVAADAARAFEKLPLEADLHLLRSVIYEGIWQKFNANAPSAE